jgi:hypothetical protein
MKTQNLKGFSLLTVILIIGGILIVGVGINYGIPKYFKPEPTKKIMYEVLVSNLESLNYQGNTPRHSKDGIDKDIFSWNGQYLIIDKHCYSGDLNNMQYRECDKSITIIYQRPDPKFRADPQYSFDLKRCIYTPQIPYQNKCGEPYLLNNGLCISEPEEGFREDWQICCPSSTNCQCPDAAPVCRVVYAPLIDVEDYAGVASNNAELFDEYKKLVDKL